MTTSNSQTARRRGKRGPAPWPTDRVRSAHIVVRLTPGEHHDLTARAARAGLPVSSYIRALTTNDSEAA